MNKTAADLLSQLDGLTAPQLKRLLVEQLTTRKLGLYWESNSIERDAALNGDLILPVPVEELHCGEGPHRNLIIEGDNFDALRLLRASHRNRIRVIYIDPPYNTGNKDWVYNDHYVGVNDRWRHSQWLEFLYRRLTLARDLLTPDGVILVSINDENRSRLELLMDEVFPGRRLGSLVWRTKDTGNDLGQRFSHVHEHVLIYANEGFSFNGRATDRAKFRNPDGDERGDWAPRPMSTNKSLTERPNTFYPIQDPTTGYWYPCDPDSVWRFASEVETRKRLEPEEADTKLKKLRSETIETLIARRLVYFPACQASEVMLFRNKDELLTAIHSGRGPVLPKKKTPLLREDLPDLDFWIGKPIAPGRPSSKDFWNVKPESERTAPLSSWISGMNEALSAEEEEELAMLRSERGGVATEEIKAVFGNKAFPYPKPLSLMQGLLAQATRPGDTVLDFFAGSGTTANAVLALNAEDGGDRRFILCSSTEATAREPDKNLCRDVCAGRMRRVIDGGSGAPGYAPEHGGNFAYLRLHKTPPADATYELTDEHAHAWLSLHRLQAISTMPAAAVKTLGRVGDCDLLLVMAVNTKTIQTLAAWPSAHGCERLAIYCKRPEGLAEELRARGVQANVYGLMETLQGGAA